MKRFTKVVKFTKAFKYTITSASLAVAILNLTLYQPGKGRLRNYVNNLQRGLYEGHKYPRDIKWVVDSLAAIHSVPPHATYKQWFKTRPFTNHRTAGEGGGHFFNFSLPLPPASQILRHQPSGYFVLINQFVFVKNI